MEMRHFPWVALSAVIAVMASCSVPPKDGSSLAHDGGVAVGPPRTPVKHRAASASCPQERAAGMPVGGCLLPSSCTGDGDCTAGANGRCLLTPPGCGHECSYDTCASDSDCPDNGVCACRSSSTDTSANTCYAGNCRIDADCGPGGFCSPSLVDPFPCENCWPGYFCHTPMDSCLDDADCDDPNGPAKRCVFDAKGSRLWACAEVFYPG